MRACRNEMCPELELEREETTNGWDRRREQTFSRVGSHLRKCSDLTTLLTIIIPISGCRSSIQSISDNSKSIPLFCCEILLINRKKFYIFRAKVFSSLFFAPNEGSPFTSDWQRGSHYGTPSSSAGAFLRHLHHPPVQGLFSAVFTGVATC